MPHTSDHTCECEHIEHFPQMDAVVEDRVVAPPASHAYGAADQAVTVRTPFGHFAVCQWCADNHYQEYPRV